MNATQVQQGKLAMAIPAYAVIIICGIAFGVGSWVHYLITLAPTVETAAPAKPISIGDVQQVIAALNTLAKPQRYDFDPPVKITVQGDGLIRIHLETRREVKFESRGHDLVTAVADLSHQAREVSDLKIWPETPR